MATPMLLMFTDQTPTKTAQEHTKVAESANNRGRKPSNKSSTTKKKQPQRGMGVAQLERLRLQERWKKMTQIPDPVQYPIGSVPVHYGAGNYYGPMIGSGTLMSLDPGLMVQRVPNGGGVGGFCGGVGSGQVLVDPNWLGSNINTAFETSRELSSMPKMHHCEADRSDACVKKYPNQDTAVFCGGSDMYNTTPPTPINSCDFLGMIQNHPNFAGEINGFGTTRMPKSATGASHNLINEGVEVLAIHRKGSSVGGRPLMEYEFFPGKNGRKSSSTEEMITEASVAEGGGSSEASFVNTSSSSSSSTANRASASNSVDLSLKLSFY